MVFCDPDFTSLSKSFQAYLVEHNIQLLHCGAESHWQLGRVEIANRILRGIAQRVWKISDRPPEEVIELAATTRNQMLRKSGYSPSQWFLGQDQRTPGWLLDVDAQNDPAVQSQIVNQPSFAAKMHLREAAAQACLAEHSKDIWRRAIAARNTPVRGPYSPGQLVYFFRRRGRAQLSTRHGVWLGPARVIGVESSTGSSIPRLVWVSFNGFLNRCSPEGLRPVPEDEAEFKRLAKELASGSGPPDLESAENALRRGQYQDCTEELPQADDFELESDIDDEPDSGGLFRSTAFKAQRT